MIAVDTNILVYAHRKEFEKHKAAHRFLVDQIEGSEPWGLPIFCFAEFIRVTTHPAYLNPPSSLDAALTFLDRAAGSPSARILYAGEGYLSAFRKCCKSGGVLGNRAFDSAVVAVCLAHGIREIVTEDRDFARFSEITATRLK